MEEITIEDFMKIDLRVAKILSAEPVEGADKLLQLNLDIGEFGTKTVYAGIKNAYKVEELEGKMVVCVNNLKSRKMRLGTSEGMILAAGGDEGVFPPSRRPQTALGRRRPRPRAGDARLRRRQRPLAADAGARSGAAQRARRAARRAHARGLVGRARL